MKTTKLGLLALSTMTLGMSIAANAATTTAIDLNGEKLGSFSSGSFTIGSPLQDLDVVSISIKNAPPGTSSYNTFFTVAQDSIANGNAFDIKASSGAAVTLTGAGVTGGWNAADQQYEFQGLQAGVTYDWQTTATVTGAAGSFGSQLSVAAVPEPEEWAMMLVGTGLVGFQVRRKQKGENQSAAF